MGRLDWRIGALLALSSCIIYRVESDRAESPIEVPDRTGDDEDDLPSTVRLVIDEGAPGQTLRTTLTTPDSAGLRGLQGVQFERDVTVLDVSLSSTQAELLIRVAAEAELGAIDVEARFSSSAVVRAAEGFTIVAAEVEPSDTGSDDTGATTIDTSARDTAGTGTAGSDTGATSTGPT